MFHKFPKRSGIYHITDSIENLLLEIHFRHVNSLLKLPKFDFLNNKNVAANDGEAAIEDEDVQICRIKWQQKILSAKEMELYKETTNCQTDTQKRYNLWLNEGGGPRVGEKKVPDDEGSSRKGKPKRRSKKTQKLQEMRKENELPKNNEIFTYVNEDNFIPKEEKSPNAADDSVELMYIYAALNPDTQVIAIRWHTHQRMLHIYPDFSSLHDNPYFIEIDTDYRHLYSYSFENISKWRAPTKASYAESMANYLHLPELPTHWSAEYELSSKFVMPPKHTQRFSLLFEIGEGNDFEYDNIHVRYHIQLPANTLLEEGLLEASTHSSSVAGSTSGCCYFGYNWQLTLLCEENFNSAELLHIYFEVISIDSWERERIEGYTHCSTYLVAGCDSQNLQCLRPADSFWDSVNRYFIGGRRKFDFVRFFSSTPESKFQRFNCRMRSTGQLQVSCQRLTQRNCELLKPCISRTSGMTLDDIMLAYREARRRLEALN